MKITYLDGDATEPVGKDRKLIIHVCNTFGIWGAGFVLALSKKWKEPEAEYRRWAKSPLKLGAIQFVSVEKDIEVVNMIAQEGIGWKNGIPPIRYDALANCLKEVRNDAVSSNASIHMPDLIGCGLAGGNRSKVLDIVRETFRDTQLEIYIYTLVCLVFKG